MELKRVDHTDFGCSEDEFNNFLIEMYELMKNGQEVERNLYSAELIPSDKSPVAGEAVTVTLHKGQYTGRDISN